MNSLTVAVCTYNRAHRLPDLVTAIRCQECPILFEILAVNNNSKDNSGAVLRKLAAIEGPPLRFVNETCQGIVPARNRALDEAMASKYLVFIDDDELPMPGFLRAAVDALEGENAECVGGRVRVNFKPGQRPKWMGAELLGFLAEVDYGDEAFWITDASTPIWTANVAYRMSLFSEGLRFDTRYNREGKGVAGGEDAIMFRTLLKQGALMRYRPDMVVEHFVEDWRLRRGYFLKRHFGEGFIKGRWELDNYPNTLFGVPPFLIVNTLKHWTKTFRMWASGKPGVLRQAMNAMHAMGMIAGTFRRYRDKKV